MNYTIQWIYEVMLDKDPVNKIVNKNGKLKWSDGDAVSDQFAAPRFLIKYWNYK